MSHRYGIATEGPASAAVIQEICNRIGIVAKTRFSQGKTKLYSEFPRILYSLGASPFHASAFLVVPDLHPSEDCVTETARWNTRIASYFPKAQLCLAIWETESWLVADLDAVSKCLGADFKAPRGDSVGGEKPSEHLEVAYRRQGGYRKGMAFDKSADGVRIVRHLRLDVACNNSPSLKRFVRLLKR